MSCLYCTPEQATCEWCKPPAAKRSPFAGCTSTQARRVKKGYHPMALPMPPQDSPLRDETCGTCRHLERHDSYRRNYLKCALTPQSHGSATDTRAKWPACAKWEGKS